MIIREASATDAQNVADIHTISWRNNYQNALTAHYLSNVYWTTELLAAHDSYRPCLTQ
jgi:hypothetical protein